MQVLAAVTVGVLFAASILVGIRLLALHRRTGGMPELLLGAMLLLVTGVGYPLRIAAQRASQAWAGPFVIVSDVAICIGFSLLFAFTVRVFRPQAIWARVVAAAGVIAMAGATLASCVEVYEGGAIDLLQVPLSDHLIRTGPMAFVYVWTAWESLRYHAMMRRRVKHDLADATVANRFLLWGLMALLATVGIAFSVWVTSQHMNAFNTPWILFLSSASGLGQAVFLVLAFVPPRSYLGWVRGRATAASGA